MTCSINAAVAFSGGLAQRSRFTSWHDKTSNSQQTLEHWLQLTHTAQWPPKLQCLYQWCGLRPSVLGQDRSGTKKGLGLAGLVLCSETRSCHARCHNDLVGHSNSSSTIYNFSILCLEHNYCDMNFELFNAVHSCFIKSLTPWRRFVIKYGVRVSRVKPSNCFRLHSTSMISKHSTIPVPDSL